MARSRKKKPSLVINTSIWLKYEEKFEVVEELEHTPRPGEIQKIDGERWRVVEWTDRIECERVTAFP